MAGFAQLLEALRVFLFQRRSFLQERRELLFPTQ